jgi:hypothetical protein
MQKKSQKKSTKPTRRSRVQYPGLVKNVNTKVRQELIDHDYIDKLNDKEKEFLSNFNEEYLGANFQHRGKQLHKSKKRKRDCYNRNNARNRDIYSISNVTGNLTNLDYLLDKIDDMDIDEIMEIRMFCQTNNLTLEQLEKRFEALNDTSNNTNTSKKLKDTN